jgi:hypothetical protein
LKAYDEVWFTTIPIGCNQLNMIMDKLTIDFPDLCEKMLSNKTSRGIGITRMGEPLVPREYGMEVIGYMDPISYGKFLNLFLKII